MVPEVWLLGVNNYYVSVNAAASMTFWYFLIVPGNSPLGYGTSEKLQCCRGARSGCSPGQMWLLSAGKVACRSEVGVGQLVLSHPHYSQLFLSH